MYFSNKCVISNLIFSHSALVTLFHSIHHWPQESYYLVGHRGPYFGPQRESEAVLMGFPCFYRHRGGSTLLRFPILMRLLSLALSLSLRPIELSLSAVRVRNRWRFPGRPHEMRSGLLQKYFFGRMACETVCYCRSQHV